MTHRTQGNTVNSWLLIGNNRSQNVAERHLKCQKEKPVNQEFCMLQNNPSKMKVNRTFLRKQNSLLAHVPYKKYKRKFFRLEKRPQTITNLQEEMRSFKNGKYAGKYF